MTTETLIAAAHAVLEDAKARGLMLAAAESCTGGLIAASLTAIPGSSAVFERGFVTYSNQAKIELLGVFGATIAAHGAVSEETARAMAEGALRASRADLAVSVTGIAGPDGGTETKPVGLVHIAAARRGGATLHQELRLGAIGRTQVREVSALAALALLARAMV